MRAHAAAAGLQAHKPAWWFMHAVLAVARGEWQRTARLALLGT